jgi:hypothetical protein
VAIRPEGYPHDVLQVAKKARTMATPRVEPLVLAASLIRCLRRERDIPIGEVTTLSREQEKLARAREDLRDSRAGMREYKQRNVELERELTALKLVLRKSHDYRAIREAADAEYARLWPGC